MTGRCHGCDMQCDEHLCPGCRRRYRQIFVQTVTGKVITVDVLLQFDTVQVGIWMCLVTNLQLDLRHPTSTIVCAQSNACPDQALKEAVHASEGVIPAYQRLAFAGTQLQHGRTLASYNIQEGATVDLLPREFDGACWHKGALP